MPQRTMIVKDDSGALITVYTLPPIGQDVKGNSLPVTIASDDELLLAVRGVLKTSPSGSAFTQTIVTLTANQAAGTDPLLVGNASRRALQFAAYAGSTPTDFKIALSAAAANGLTVFGSARDDFAGSLCPTGALYLVPGSGLSTGATIVIWEA